MLNGDTNSAVSVTQNGSVTLFPAVTVEHTKTLLSLFLSMQSYWEFAVMGNYN